jgi:hypothetical protein
MLIFEVLLFVTVSWSIVEDDGIKSCKSWHPILMTFGFAFCMNEGLLAFYFGDICDKARNDSRKKHGILQVLSIFSVLAGYIVMFIHHFGSKKSNGTNKTIWEAHFGAGEPPIVLLHVWLGYTLIILTVVNVIIGIQKYVTKSKTGKSIAKWHGKLGLVIYLLGMFNIVVATIFWGQKKTRISWKSQTVNIVSFIVMVISMNISMRSISKAVDPKEETTNLSESLLTRNSLSIAIGENVENEV